MRNRITARLLSLPAVAVCIVVVFCGCGSLSHVHRAPEDSSGLWMGVCKPFGGPVYYFGSEGEFSYFHGHGVFCDRYKARTAKLNLPRTFPFGKERPYVVSLDMVPQY
jgi:hypothetical protein